MALSGCGGGAPPANAPAPATGGGDDASTTAEPSDAEPSDAELEAALRATWAEHRARLEAAAEAGDVETFLRETGTEPPETMTEAERAAAEPMMRVLLGMLDPIEADERLALRLREGDRAALVLERRTCDAGSCDMNLRILRFAREDGEWRARGTHYSTGERIDEGRAAAWTEAWLTDPRFALEAPPPAPDAEPGS